MTKSKLWTKAIIGDASPRPALEEGRFSKSRCTVKKVQKQWLTKMPLGAGSKLLQGAIDRAREIEAHNQPKIEKFKAKMPKEARDLFLASEVAGA